MELTGKAKKDFEAWVCRPDDPEYVKEMHIDLMYGKSYVERYAYYLEWLDSVGIYVMIGRYGYSINIDNEGSWNRKESGTRTEITKKAIIHANKIYNQKFKDEN